MPDDIDPFAELRTADEPDEDEDYGAPFLPLDAYANEFVEAAEQPRQDAGFFTAASLHGQPVPPRQWHVEDFIPAGTVTTLSGDGGSGKSLLALQLAVATALARPWLGMPVAAGAVLYLSAEDDRDELHRRLADIAKAEGVALADMDRLHLRSLAGHDALMSIPARKGGVLIPTPLFGEIARWVAENAPTLIVLDTLADLFGGDEINRGQARQFIGMWRGLALDNDATVVLLAHPSLSGMARGDGNSGSTAWNNSVRSRLYFRRIKGDAEDEPDPNARELEVMKANYGATGRMLPLRWQAGVFQPEAREDGFLDRMAAGAKADRVFARLLRECHANGRRVNHSGGNTYAPKVFAAHPQSEGVSQAAFRRAMETALANGTARIEAEGPPSRRVNYLVPEG